METISERKTAVQSFTGNCFRELWYFDIQQEPEGFAAF